MVTDSDGYIQLIEYLTEHFSLFEHATANENIAESSPESIIATIEIELSDQIISVCNQNQNLNFNQRNTIIREVDTILYDLQEILSSVVDNPVTEAQSLFIKEFATLIKNLFDSEIAKQVS